MRVPTLFALLATGWGATQPEPLRSFRVYIAASG